MSNDVRLPRQRKPQFLLLGLCVLSFVASFWWAARLPVSKEAAMVLWFVHLLAISGGLMARAAWYKGFVAKDYAHARQFILLTHDDIALIKDKSLDCTIYELEGDMVPSPGAFGGVRRDYEYRAEFHNDDDHVWFLMARKTPPKPVSIMDLPRWNFQTNSLATA